MRGKTITRPQYLKIKRAVRSNISTHNAVELFNISPTTVSRIRTAKNFDHYRSKIGAKNTPVKTRRTRQTVKAVKPVEIEYWARIADALERIADNTEQRPKVSFWK